MKKQKEAATLVKEFAAFNCCCLLLLLQPEVLEADSKLETWNYRGRFAVGNRNAGFMAELKSIHGADVEAPAVVSSDAMRFLDHSSVVWRGFQVTAKEIRFKYFVILWRFNSWRPGNLIRSLTKIWRNKLIIVNKISKKRTSNNNGQSNICSKYKLSVYTKYLSTSVYFWANSHNL